MDAANAPLSHTPDHRNCPACEAERQKKLDPKKFGLLYFKQAAPLWLKEHSASIGEKQVRCLKSMMGPLVEFFGELPLNEIHIGHVTVFMNQRLQTPRRSNAAHQGEFNFGPLVGANTVRKELNALGQIMGRAGLWDEIGKDVVLPKLPKTKVGRALEDHEIELLFTIARSSRRWKLAEWTGMISIQTTADEGEILHLHLNDVDLARDTVRIRDGLKNEHRDRIIEMKHLPEVRKRFKLILARYYKICRRQAITPDAEHYIFPGRRRDVPGFDPSTPMRSSKKAWNALVEKAGLDGLRRKDLRHTALTKLLENPELSERTIVEIAGHISKEMWKVYSHIRRKPKQDAMRSLHFEAPVAAGPPPSPLDSVQPVDLVDIEPNAAETNVTKK